MRDEHFRDEWPVFFLRTTLVLATLAAALATCSCAHVPPPPAGNLPANGLARLYKVAPHLYRSAQPDAAQFYALATQYRVDTVIKLNFTVEGRDDLAAAAISLVYSPWLGAGPVEHEDVQQVEDVIAGCLARTDDSACLIHCEQGVDRTGLAVALARVRRGTAPKDAFDEWVRFGSHRFFLLEETFYRETGWRP